MLFRDNPVLTRELLVTLRSPRAFVLQWLYVSSLGALVYFYWPSGGEGGGHQVSSGRGAAALRHLLPRPVLPGGARGADVRRGSITGEKERKTYEMLLASPLRPGTILVGKLLSSLSYLVILIISSLPLMILCYLLGGLLLSEIARALPRLDPAGRDVRAAEHRLLELLPPDQLGPGRQLPGDPPAGRRLRRPDPHRERPGARLRLDRRAPAVVPGDLDGAVAS